MAKMSVSSLMDRLEVVKPTQCKEEILLNLKGLFLGAFSLSLARLKTLKNINGNHR